MTEREPARIIPYPPLDGAAFWLRVDSLLPDTAAWRTLVMPVRATFWDLHLAIGDAHGWAPVPGHVFRVDDPQTGQRRRLGAVGPGAGPPPLTREPSWAAALARLLHPDGRAALYVNEGVVPRTLAVAMVGGGPRPDRGPWPRCDAGAGGGFGGEAIVFANPQQCWSRMFGHD